MTGAALAAVRQGIARWANPSSPHAEGRASRAALEEARRRIAKGYGRGHDLILISGASAALSLSLGRALAPRRRVCACEPGSATRRGSDNRWGGDWGSGMGE